MKIQAALGSATRTSNGRQTAEVAARGSLLLVGLVGGLGALAGNLLEGGGLREGELDLQLQGDRFNIYLDNTDSDSLPHVPDGKPAEGRELGEGLDTHGLGGDQLHNGGVSGLDELGRVLSGLTGTSVFLLKDLGELAGEVHGVAVQHRGVVVGHLRYGMNEPLKLIFKTKRFFPRRHVRTIQSDSGMSSPDTR